MTDKYVLDGKTPRPVDSLEEWARELELTNRHVDQTFLDGVRISTVFLGLDHNPLGGPPLLFETMIFGGPHDGYQERCSTWEEAEEQHKVACRVAATEPEGG